MPSHPDRVRRNYQRKTVVSVCDHCHSTVRFVEQDDSTYSLERFCCLAPRFSMMTKNPRKLGVINGLTT